MRGERIGSPYPERRRWYIVTNPRIELLELVHILTEVKNRLIGIMPPFLEEKPWWLVKPCPLCLERARRLLGRVNNIEDLTRRGVYLCTRHIIPHVLKQVDIIDNKSRVLKIEDDNDRIVLGFRFITNRHDIDLRIPLDGRDIEAVLDNRSRYVYSNHLNAFPLLSSYGVIILSLIQKLETMRLLLFLEYKKVLRDLEIIYNET